MNRVATVKYGLTVFSITFLTIYIIYYPIIYSFARASLQWWPIYQAIHVVMLVFTGGTLITFAADYLLSKISL